MPVRWLDEQEEHSCSPSIADADIPAHGQTVAVLEDAGGGPYLVLSCCEVAFDDVQQFDEWAAKVRAVVQIATKEPK